MGKMLIIPEKPSVARDIAAALGGFSKVGDWLESPTAVVSPAAGHLVEIHAPEALTAPKDLASLPIIPPMFELRPIARARAQLTLLVRLMGRADVTEIVNACDAGREGELIFRLIYEFARCRKPVRRMWLQSMTIDAIREAHRRMRPGSDYDRLADAAKCRSEADWLIGINGSRGITRLRERQAQQYEMTNVGRVQTPTLAILVHREQAIRAFTPRAYWEVHATFRAKAGTYLGKWTHPSSVPTVPVNDNVEEGGRAFRIFDKAHAESLVTRCQHRAPSSVHDTQAVSISAPPRLFDLTSLQRDANRRYRLSAKRTLDVAQALYERHKATTYPRTSSTALPEDYVEMARTILGTFGAPPYADLTGTILNSGWVGPDKRIFDNARVSDHFAIIPTGTHPVDLNEAEAKIYDLIVRRFIAAFYPAAEYRATTRVTTLAGEAFKSTGRILIRRGWLEVYAGLNEPDQVPSLCPVEPSERVHTEAVEAKAMQTRPPPRLTEAMLLSAMEGAGDALEEDELREAMKDCGLGTPATRASHIEGLLSTKDGGGRHKHPYAIREGRAQHLAPTDKGMELIEFLDSNGIIVLTSARLTGEWEQKLAQVEKGLRSRRAFMEEVQALTRSVIAIIREKADSTPAPPPLAAGCPKCGAPVLVLPRTFECDARCGFRLWRQICRRELSAEEATRLLQTGALAERGGFLSRSDKSFRAGLKLNTTEWKVELVFTGSGDRSVSVGASQTRRLRRRGG